MRNLKPEAIGVRSTLLALLAAALLIASPGAAQTPDGQTPAEEDICDEMMGASWGLCNAYCEAMDCDLYFDDDETTVPSASAQACDRVLANFEKVSGLACPPCLLCECVPENDPCLATEECCEGLVCKPGIGGDVCGPGSS
jgi:hypothetical protein